MENRGYINERIIGINAYSNTNNNPALALDVFRFIIAVYGSESIVQFINYMTEYSNENVVGLILLFASCLSPNIFGHFLLHK